MPAAPPPEPAPGSVPARDLDSALGAMRFRVEPDVFALAAFPGGLDAARLARLSAPCNVVVEDGVTSVLARASQLAPWLDAPGVAVEPDLVWITLVAPMGWEVVGFLARVSAALAREGVPMGAVASHARDHVFVARRHLPGARRALLSLFPEAPG